MELAPKILDVTLRWREVDSNFPFRAVNEHPSWSRLRSRRNRASHRGSATRETANGQP